MNTLDVILIILIGLNIYGGIRKGLIRQIAALFGIFLGFFIAYHYYQELAELLGNRFGLRDFFLNITGTASQLFPGLPDALVISVSLILIFIATAIVAGISGSVLARMMKVVKLSFVDRLAGGGLGLFKGLLIALIIAQILLLVPMTSVGQMAEDSYIAPRLSTYAPQVFDEISEWIQQRIPDNGQ